MKSVAYANNPPSYLALTNFDVNQKAVIEYLLKQGADSSIKDNSGKTAYDYALENGNTEVADLMKTDKN